MQVLVGDIGGTKTNLALVRVGETFEVDELRRYASASADSFGTLVRRYLDETGITCTAASFALAGPVRDDRCKATNLLWELDARALEREFGFGRVRLINDLEAMAWGLQSLRSDRLYGLHEGEPPSEGGNTCVIAAGTGLGLAGMIWDGARHHPFATEAGHADFAPISELEFALFRRLQRRHGHVSWERVVSGPGIVNLFEFLFDWHGAAVPDWLEQPEAATEIAHAAARGSCSICVETMELFATLYARVIGDFALAHLAVGGIYLAGGVTLGNRRLLTRDGFVQTVFDKGRMSELLRRMPIRVILEEHLGLLGAARSVCA